MNDTTATQPMNAAAEYLADADQCARRNPIPAILVAAGTGLAIALLVRALRPEPTPQYRLARLLDDLEGRLRGVAGPVMNKARGLASDGLDAAQQGEAEMERAVGGAAGRVRRWFS